MPSNSFEARCPSCDGGRVYEIVERIEYYPVLTVDENGLPIRVNDDTTNEGQLLDYWCDDCNGTIPYLRPAHSSPNGPPEPIDTGDE